MSSSSGLSAAGGERRAQLEAWRRARAEGGGRLSSDGCSSSSAGEVGGFGTVQWIDPQEYLLSCPDAIVQHQPAKTLQVRGGRGAGCSLLTSSTGMEAGQKQAVWPTLILASLSAGSRE